MNVQIVALRPHFQLNTDQGKMYLILNSIRAVCENGLFNILRLVTNVNSADRTISPQSINIWNYMDED
jgi:hypothetical protein